MKGTLLSGGVDALETTDAVSVDALHSRGREASEAYTALADAFDEVDDTLGVRVEYEVDEGVDRNGERVFRTDTTHPVSVTVNVDERNVSADTLRLFIDVAHEYDLHLWSYDLEVKEWLTQYTLSRYDR